MIRAIVFDLDGVLLDASDIHHRALNDALKLVGFEISPEQRARLFEALPTRLKLELLSSTTSLPEALHPLIYGLKQKITQEILGNLAPDENLLALLAGLRGRGYRLGLATNSIRSTVDLVLQRRKIGEFFEVVICSDEVKSPKPNPEIYRLAFEKLKIDPSAGLVIEDSIHGITAAAQVTKNVAFLPRVSDLTRQFIERQIARCERNSGAFHDERKNVLNIVIPMAGRGDRFAKAGFRDPKPLIDVNGRPMIEWVVDNVSPKNVPHRFTFICLEEHLQKYALASLLEKIAPGSQVVSIPDVTQGAACSVLLTKARIDNGSPLLIVNSDQWLDINIDDFLRTAGLGGNDGVIMTFPATEKKWSFARTDSQGWVVEVAEKNPISSNATTGAYYFAQGSTFVRMAEQMIMKDIRTRNEFYVCPVFNELIGAGLKIRTYPIRAEQMHSMGTPEDLAIFLSTRERKIAA